MRRSRQTKIIATIGPAGTSDDVLARLFQAGAFRFSFCHGMSGARIPPLLCGP